MFPNRRGADYQPQRAPELVAAFLIITPLTTVIAMYAARNHQAPQPVHTETTPGAIR